jgi:hypothetical protein
MIPSLLSFLSGRPSPFIHRPDYNTITRPCVEIKYCTPLLPGVVTTLRDDCNRTIHCTYINNNNTNKSSFILSYRSITTIIQCESRLQNNVVPWTPAYNLQQEQDRQDDEMDRRKDAKTQRRQIATWTQSSNCTTHRVCVCVCTLYDLCQSWDGGRGDFLTGPHVFPTTLRFSNQTRKRFVRL